MLLIGPPGSGKTHRVLEELEACLGRKKPAMLVTPTASMAEHLQHQLARRGLVVSTAVLPLADYAASFTPQYRELSPAMETLLVERAVEQAAPPEFAAVAGYPGFHSKLLETMAEIWAAGRETPPASEAFGRVVREFEKLLREAGAVHRAERLRLAAAEAARRKLGVVLFDGFFNFTPVELELLRAVAGAAEKILVTLPASGAEEAREALVGMGLAETRLETVYRHPRQPVVVRAASPEREIEGVAGRIWSDRQATGRPFHEYGLILRAPEVYGPVVETVFERFGIPFRSRQPQMLEAHSSIRFLAGLLRLAATGFDGAETLEVLKLAGSGIGLAAQMDRYEFDLRGELPNQGLDFLKRRAVKLPLVKETIERLEKLEEWAGESRTPESWARGCGELAQTYFHPPAVEDRVSHEAALEWKTLAAALAAWPLAAQDAAEALRLGEVRKIRLEEYRKTLQAVLRLTPLRTPDRRRNVVQVLSVYEARQWELPVVFVCGLVEKQFPRYHAQNLFFPDARRHALRAKGWRLRTSADRDREERFLFDLAITRATEQVYLTYPTHDETGAETLASFFLEPWQAEPARRVRAKEPAPQWRPARPYLDDPELHRAIERKHPRFSPSSLEQYIQCPFLFFAERTLQLKGPPPAPEERVDALLKGTIVHRAIARWAAQGPASAPEGVPGGPEGTSGGAPAGTPGDTPAGAAVGCAAGGPAGAPLSTPADAPAGPSAGSPESILVGTPLGTLAGAPAGPSAGGPVSILAGAQLGTPADARAGPSAGSPVTILVGAPLGTPGGARGGPPAGRPVSTAAGSRPASTPGGAALGPIRPVFEEVFDEVCRQEGIRLNFRAEAMKMELLADLERFAEEERARGVAPGFHAGKPESEFEFIVEEGVERAFRIRGRIDRYEISPQGAALVVDYKYSPRERIERLVEEHEEGVRLQGPLYLLAIEKQWGLEPAGMIFHGLRKETTRRGWYAKGLAPPDPDLEERSREEVRALLQRAAQRVLEIVGEIRAGRIEVAPRDRQVCREYCPYRDVCRVDL